LNLPATIGRGSKATSRVAGNRYISRIHARVEETADGYTIIDLSSSNKTLVNGVGVDTIHPVFLKDGDHITLADEEFIFVVEGSNASTGF
jgi:pSer/pThr/pTyr-binding forkhead associated (FHA) protein